MLENTNYNVPPYYFYDLQGHVYTDLSVKDRVSLSFYNGLDDLNFDSLLMCDGDPIVTGGKKAIEQFFDKN